MKKEKVFDCQKLSFYHIKCYSMNYTYNAIGGFRFAENVNKRGEGIMKSQFASELTMRIWIDFKSHFKSQTTEASYQSDLDEIMEYTGKDFLKLSCADVDNYYNYMKERIDEGQLKGSTAAKKFRELHSFAQYLCENRENYHIQSEDLYEPYLKLLEKQEKLAKSVPVGDIDKLFEAAKNDRMAYCIFALLYRMGLSSTEIIELSPNDFYRYENGMYVEIQERRELSYVPEDVEEILLSYLEERTENKWLFYNRRGNQLNTMYISRLMKKYTSLAGIPNYSAQSLRNTCGFTLSSYGASPKQTAAQLGITTTQIQRYDGKAYKNQLQKEVQNLVHVKIVPPEL